MKLKKGLLLALCLCLAGISAGCTTIDLQMPVSTFNAITGWNISGVSQTETTAVAEEALPVTEAPSVQPASEATTALESAAPVSEAATAAPVTVPVSEATTAAAGNTAPASKDEIIAYYVTAYNKIAADAKSVTRTYDYTSNYNNILQINNNATLEKLAGSLMKKFMVENKEAVASTAEDLPPVGVTTLAITSSQISTATCTDKGTYYEVVLKSTGTDSDYEVDAEAGKGSAGVIGPLLRTADVTDAVGSAMTFTGLHAWYAAASVTAKIDKASGHITEFHFETPTVLHFDNVKVAIISVSDCNIGLLFTQNWTVAY